MGLYRGSYRGLLRGYEGRYQGLNAEVLRYKVESKGLRS